MIIYACMCVWGIMYAKNYMCESWKESLSSAYLWMPDDLKILFNSIYAPPHTGTLSYNL